MKFRAGTGSGKQVRHESADNRSYQTEHDRPKQRHVHVHDRFRNKSRNQADDDVPDEMKQVTSLEYK